MTVKELIKELEKFNSNMDMDVVVCIVGEYVNDIHTIEMIKINNDGMQSYDETDFETDDPEVVLALLHY